MEEASILPLITGYTVLLMLTILQVHVSILYLLGGNDIVDYPLMILPKNHGTFSGALIFVAKSTDTLCRYKEDLDKI